MKAPLVFFDSCLAGQRPELLLIMLAALFVFVQNTGAVALHCTRFTERFKLKHPLLEPSGPALAISNEPNRLVNPL